MKTCCRSCGRTGIFGIDGLISLGIVKFLVDIGRKGNLTGFVQDFFPNAVKVKSDNAVAVLKDLFTLGFEFVLYECESSAFVYLFAGPCKSLPVIIVDPLEKKELYGTFGVTPDA